MTLAIVVAVVAVSGIALAVGLAWRRSARARASLEAAYEQLPEPLGWARAASAAGVTATPDQIALALDLAVCCLDDSGPWGIVEILTCLEDLRILVRADAEWTDAYGRRVAGLTYPTDGIVVVGADLAALCHELAELLYWRIEGADDWQAREWPGRAGIEAACAAYAERRRAA